MKNVFKFLGIALVAGALLTACGEKYTVTVNVNDNAMGTVTGAGDYDPDASCTLTATPNAGYMFVSWSDGTNTITENPYTFTVKSDVTYTATFAKREGVQVTFGSASWTADPNASAFYHLGQYNDFYLAVMPVSGQLPQACFWANCAVGEHASNFIVDEQYGYTYDNEDAYRCDYYAEGAVSVGNQTRGDWWARTWSAKVNSYDATSMTVDATITATMFDVMEAFGEGGTDDPATASQQNLTANVAVTLTEAPTKISK